MWSKSLVLAAVVAAVTASPVAPRSNTIALPVTKHSYVTSLKNIVNRGKATIHRMNSGATFGNVDANSGPATNEDVTYVAGFSIGGRVWQLIVDTGSSNTWCGASTRCEPTSSGKSTGSSVSVTYGSGSFRGTEYTDTVSFAGLTVPNQSIGAASSATGFSGVDGIVGFGPVGLTTGTVSGQGAIPTFMNNLRRLGLISVETLGVYFKPVTGSSTSEANGELTLGGVDTAKYTGTLTYFPKLTSGTAAAYWGIAVSSFTYGTTTLASNAQAIVDTGTTLIYIPSAAYRSFLSATGGTTDSSSGLASFTRRPTANFNIRFGSTTYTLTPAQYLVPTAQYANFGLSSSKSYAWINDGGTGGVNTIIGQKFLENYYSVYDTTNSRIGFATRT